jgi:two-component system chemotaxis response regulator CheB
MHDIIVLGASAGGVDALGKVVRGLPPGLPASLFVVCHFPPGGRSVLPHLLSRSGPLLAQHAQDGEPTYPGHIYVAPPDYHLLLTPGHVRLSHGPRENRLRPSIDVLFRSAARVYGARVVAVLLSGSHHDGVAGLLAVRAAGGGAALQDPLDAEMSALPRSAEAVAGADYIEPASRLADLLVQLVHRPAAGGGKAMPDPLDKLPEVVAADQRAQTHDEKRGQITVFTCPECGGSLWQVDETGALRFRCHVGHAYQAEALMDGQSEALEAALWTAVRIFRDKGVLARQVAARERGRGNLKGAQGFEEQAVQDDHYATLIQEHILGNNPTRGPTGTGELPAKRRDEG